ncbi:MAG: DEAD/DEAH box helicase, partial [Acidimicrobiia bacterium]|nr:DEAD/DEAH box helicase [Acidimicrobiia bacterium]
MSGSRAKSMSGSRAKSQSQARLRSAALRRFSPAAAEWFATTFPQPTAPQVEGWPRIAAGDHTLILAPTGSGKTLTAFFWGLDQLTTRPRPAAKTHRTRIVYISPLRALAVDVEKNLRAPLQGVRLAAERLGEPFHEPRVALRTGDTPADVRRQLSNDPPDLLITTPESLYLMLTSRARETLAGVETVIVDEIHALAATKRGAHLALSLERLERVTDRPPQRIGLSATQRPLEEIARFLGGHEPAGEEGSMLPRPVTIVDTGVRKALDLEVVVPVDDMARLGEVIDEPVS